ncbi:EAL domain-containing protein [Pelomonas sp. APW6]|uniref:EAL domain-containing protein n=1 Tax=Roseateles subflavus TaxID=3053353 RepID=A0ABT7LL17_9BURK|nr:EAL domain-containing protein [Pelomonas sp. APW6]MDL5033528.1 EAL domain-containing protein [Pelomonas sp. APW6]
MFAAALATTLILCAALYKLSVDAEEAVALVSQTHQLLAKVSLVRNATLQSELDTQNFRLTGQQVHRRSRDLQLVRRESALAGIQRLVEDDAAQLGRWEQLRQVIDQRMAIANEIVRLREEQGLEAATAYAMAAPLQATRARMHVLLDALEGEAVRQQQLYIDRQTRTREQLRWAGAVVSAALLAVLAASHVLIRRQLAAAQEHQQDLAEREEHLDVTLRSIGDAVLVTDTEGRVRRMNPAAEHLLDSPLEQSQGRDMGELLSLVDADSETLSPLPLTRLAEAVRASGLQARLQRPDGSLCAVNVMAAPLWSRKRQFLGMVYVVRDTTDELALQALLRQQKQQADRAAQERSDQLLESKDHLRNVLSNVPAMIAYVDRTLRYVYVNRQYLDCFAPPLADLTGLTVEEVLGKDRFAIASPMIDKVLAGEPQDYDWEPFPGVWQAISYAPRRKADGAVEGYYVLGRDITHRKEAEQRIQVLNQHLEEHVDELQRVSRALRTLSAGNKILLRAQDEQTLLDGMCEAVVSAGGYQLAIVWQPHPLDPDRLQAVAQSGLQAGLDCLRRQDWILADTPAGQGAPARAMRLGLATFVGNIAEEPAEALWHRSLDGVTCAMACPLITAGRCFGVLAIYDRRPSTFDQEEARLLTEAAEDLAFGLDTLRTRAERQQVLAAMHRLERTDALTGLPNGTEFGEALAAALEPPATGTAPAGFALLQCNVERLKDINDTLGFKQGDALLQEIGERLRAEAPDSALVARLRGDEFAVLMRHADHAQALALVERLQRALARPVLVADIPLHVNVCMGLVQSPQDGTNPHDLFRRVDIAMQHARRKGLPCASFERSMDRIDPGKLKRAGELKRALERDELRLYLQPKVDMREGRVSGAEVLVRWQHPELGLLGPGEFIDLAEQTGLIKPLTEWVLGRTLAQLKAWRPQGPHLPLAVNLSARNLRDEDLLPTVLRLHREWGVEPGTLELEITESTVMEDASFAMRILHGLRDAGIPLYVDDFGTGYSSLAYLQRLPVDYIKIDQSFVLDMTESQNSATIVRSTIDLVHDLGRKAVAEGIESREHWRRLLGMGCDVGQGYFIARPMPVEQFPAWLKDYRAPEP